MTRRQATLELRRTLRDFVRFLQELSNPPLFNHVSSLPISEFHKVDVEQAKIFHAFAVHDWEP